MRNKHEKRVPELRFKGFVDDWEQRKLGEVAEFEKGRGYSKKELVKYGYKIILYGHLYTNYKTVIEIIDTCVENDKYSVKSKVGDIIVPSSGESSDDIARASVVPYSGIILGGDLNVITINKKILAPIFVALTVSNGHTKKELSKLSQGKSVVHLHNSDLKKVNLFFPTLKEQNIIETFFIQLENFIALHKRKLDLLKQIKQGYLQQMFPKNGENVPRLRFANFEGDWEERTFIKLLTKNNIKNRKLNIDNVESISNKYGFIKQTDQFDDYSIASTDLSNYYVIKEKYFAYNPSRINVGSIAYKHVGAQVSVVSPLYVSFSTKNILEDGFLWNWFKTFAFEKQRQKLSEGGVRDTLSFDKLSEMQLYMPITREQFKIGKIFMKLENLLVLDQQKIDKHLLQKKAIIQKMFI